MKAWRLTLAFGGLLLLAVLAFFLGFEKVEEEVEFGPGGQAAFNDFYALQRVVEELGVEASGRYGLGRLPPTDWTVVLCADDPDARQQLWWPLVEWVQEGGHVVVVPPLHIDGGPDGSDTGTPPVAEAVADTGAPAEDADVLATLGVAVVAGEEGKALTRPQGEPRILGLLTSQRLAYTGVQDGVWTIHGAPWAVRIPVDRGSFTVLADAEPLTNAYLDEGDDAVVAWELLQADGHPPGGVIFILTGDTDSVLVLVWRHARPLLLSCLVAVLLLAWRGAVRTAPVRAERPPRRRALMEHVAASGRFLWRHDLQDVLLSPARAAVRRRLGLRRGGSLDDETLVRVAAELLADARGAAAPAEHDTRRARDALLGPPPTSSAAFRAVITTLQQLWSPR